MHIPFPRHYAENQLVAVTSISSHFQASDELVKLHKFLFSWVKDCRKEKNLVKKDLQAAAELH